MTVSSKPSKEFSSFLDNVSTLVEENNYIRPDLYTKYNVKRGLRNSDSTGVLVGLTEIGEVHGYIMDEEEKVPCEGRLLYRGIDIHDIVSGFQNENRFGFEEVIYLLLFGELPSKDQLTHFQSIIGEKRYLPDGFIEDMILKAPSSNIMNSLARSVLASYSYDDNPDEISVRNILRQCIQLIAQFPAMVAYGYQSKSHFYGNNSLYIHLPRKDMSTAENFLHMIHPHNEFTALEAQILDLSLVLHAEHGGGNNSAFTTHVVSSSETDTYSAIAAAVGSLKGPKHGGANIKVMEMIDDIKSHVNHWDSEREIEDYLAKIIRKQAFDGSGLIYGMGHAVYTLSDPRAVLLKQRAAELAKVKNMEIEFQLYQNIEKLAPRVFAAEKNSDKVITANVDFYSGFVYHMLNLPLDLYTPIFSISRIAGWSAHRIEEIVSGGRIIRPAYKSVVNRKKYIPLEQRQY